MTILHIQFFLKKQKKGVWKTLFHSTILFTFFYRYRIVGVSAVSKGQDRLAGNI